MAVAQNSMISSLATTPHDYIQPKLPLYTDAVAYLKDILDPVAKDVSAEQQQRLEQARKKRKRGDRDGEESVLRLKQIHSEGFGVEQIWEQARRIIDAVRVEAERGYKEHQSLATNKAKDGVSNGVGKRVAFKEDEADEDDTEDDEEELGVEGVDYEVEGIDDGDEMYDEEEDSDLQEDGDEDEDVDGPDDLRDDFDDSEGDDGEDEEPATEYLPDKFGLNDGFFSIDDFNRQSEFLEQQDAQGENDGAASDEEDVDWDANPLALVADTKLSNGTNGGASNAAADDGEDDDDDDENGPTFGDPDASSEDEDDEVMGDDLKDIGGMGNTNEIRYADFFAPPAQKKKKNKKGRPNPHNFPQASKTDEVEDDEDDVKRTIDAVHRDLFEDEDEEEEEEDADREGEEELDPSDPRSRRSAHQRRQAALAEEIRKLEAANVAKREWTLSGEARAADRPMNSLLEEDLDFERAGKPVPVITAEVSESIEELIKRRILAHEFQDIIRRRPDDLATGKDGRRGRLDFELDDTKAKKGLAEEYEEEHLKRTDPNFVDVKDEKLSKEQKDIEALWREVSSQLDSLSSWHFRPKQAAPQLDIRVDAPVVTMEDARPNAGGDVAGASQLAPQEVYQAGEASKGRGEEVVGRSGLPAVREELSREERKRRRRRDKERIRKAGTNADSGKPGESRAARAKKDLLGDLKRGGVKVIGKKGEVKDVEGQAVKSGDGGQGAARFKL
jgi:U3 small nucleolar RNA-associated protein MPP10